MCSTAYPIERPAHIDSKRAAGANFYLLVTAMRQILQLLLLLLLLSSFRPAAESATISRQAILARTPPEDAWHPRKLLVSDRQGYSYHRTIRRPDRPQTISPSPTQCSVL
jgi:hypothetical protein